MKVSFVLTNLSFTYKTQAFKTTQFICLEVLKLNNKTWLFMGIVQ